MPSANAVQSVESTSENEHLPETFGQALRLGWTIVKEESSIDIKCRKRSGVVLLRLKGAAMRLRIPYIATSKQWKFGAPQAIE